MGRASRSFSAVLVVSLLATYVLVFLAPAVSAASWTVATDAQFNAPGSEFTGTHVVGTGAPASVQLLKDGVDWKNENPAAPPSVREGVGLAFDSSLNVSILFGGYDGGFYLNDTWQYVLATNTWTKITTTGAPPPRESPGMTYDPVQNVVVLFGGFDTSQFFADTWEYNPTTHTWTQTTPTTSPPTLVSNPMVYDPVAKRHILVGWDSVTNNFATWAYDAAAHTWALRTISGPAYRAGHALAYSVARSRTVLFGGGSPNPPPFGTLLNDTWEYNYATNLWSATTPANSPPARARHVMTYRPGSNAVLMFGGGTNSGLLSDTWRYNVTAVWEPMGTKITPAARRDAGFTFDTKGDAGILFGGRDALGNQIGDTWSLGPAYRAAGKYTSAVLDSGGASVIWSFIFWNLTVQPPGTYVRFQLAAADNATPVVWNFVGPTGLYSDYYTNPNGSAIWTGLNTHRYLRALADFGSFDDQQTPVLDDFTITYNVPPAPPYVVSTDPADMTFDVPLNKVVRVTFSKPMNTTSLVVTFLKGTPVTFTQTWSAGDSIVDLAHTLNFAENMVYQLRVDAKDKAGAALATPPQAAPNPWVFITLKIYPYIVSTSPSSGATGVPLAAPVVVTFSEPMNQTSLNVTITPTVVLTPAWSPTGDVVTLSHGTPFQQCTIFTVNVAAKDKSGLPLTVGLVANPWPFTAACINPYINNTSPTDLEGRVALNAPVIVDFSKGMDTANTAMTLSPDIGGKVFTWSNGNARLTMTHPTTPFTGCQVYTVTVTGRDPLGNPLIQGPTGSPPNPWKFVTVCNNPYMVFTSPKDKAIDVPQSKNITIVFSDVMDTTSVRYTITPAVTVLQEVWGADVQITIVHSPFQQCTRYTVQVTAGSNTGGFPLVPGPAPNPWTFDTICTAPQINSTNPKNGDVLVPLNQPVVVTFTKPMNPSTVTVTSNPGIGTNTVWSNGNMTLTINHARDFANCTLYTFTVAGNGANGDALAPGPVPNPWKFTTVCITTSPYIAMTNPAANATDVPLAKGIVVEFSKPIVRTSLRAVIAPSIVLVPTWSAGDTVVTLNHTANFVDCTWYQVTIYAKDANGTNLINVTGSPPNPWRFKSLCTSPQVLITVPGAGATGVDPSAQIIVTFSKPMSTVSVVVTIAPPVVLLPPAWSGGDTVLTLSHTVAFAGSTSYTVTVAGQDKNGAPLVPGPVPNPWTFTTRAIVPPPTGLQVIRSPPNNITLTWRPSAGASSYVVYSSTDKFAPMPWPILWEGTATSYNDPVYADGLTHYYIVKARDPSGALSANSTMGAKVSFRFTFGALGSNVHWISLPYNTIYTNAKSISDELTSLNIDVVAKWDPTTQSSVLWYYFRGRWRGTNFLISPGDGVYIGVRRNFDWVVNGTDRNVLLSFTLHSNANVNWISLPFASAYARASDVVMAIEGSLGPAARTKIVEVAKWDPTTQSLLRFYWTTTGWLGNDFAIASGEGIYLKIVASFTWTPRLLTPEVP